MEGSDPPAERLFPLRRMAISIGFGFEQILGRPGEGRQTLPRVLVRAAELFVLEFPGQASPSRVRMGTAGEGNSFQARSRSIGLERRLKGLAWAGC